jgi:uncharacterized protein (DUF58 family)
MLAQLQQMMQRGFSRWLADRLPSAPQQSLSHRNIFILPSAFGFAFIAFDFLLFLLATNYQNNLILLLSLVLASVFITSMLHSFYNLAGIQIKKMPNAGEPYDTGFADADIGIALQLTAERAKWALSFSFAGQACYVLDTLTEQQLVYVPFRSTARGKFSLGRLTISSRYPLGLFHTWTRLDFALQVVVFPKPIPVAANFTAQSSTDAPPATDEPVNKGQGDDEFYQLTAHQLGDSVARVAWKQLAKGQGWWSKQYHSAQSSPLWLVLAQMPARNVEQKLGCLVYLLLANERAGGYYGVDLDGKLIAPATGAAHLKHCLIAVALVPSR